MDNKNEPLRQRYNRVCDLRRKIDVLERAHRAPYKIDRGDVIKTFDRLEADRVTLEGLRKEAERSSSGLGFKVYSLFAELYDILRYGDSNNPITYTTMEYKKNR